MDNKNLVLQIKHDNWGEIGPNAWQGTEWKVEALDGSIWEIKRYQDKTLTWERKIGYIYGIKSLETLAGVLYKLAGLKQIKW
jgi:hypothetical protein